MRAWAMFGAAAGAAAILGLGLAVSSAGGAQPADSPAASDAAPAAEASDSPAPKRLGDDNGRACWDWQTPGPPPAKPIPPPSCTTLPDDVTLRDDGLYSQGQLWCPSACVDLWQGRYFCCAAPPY